MYLYVLGIYDIDIIFSSDEDDPNGNKFPRMEDDTIQDKERFAR